MIKYIAVVLSLAFVGCTASNPPPATQKAGERKRPKASPNLDRTYDWGARPPVANPDRERD
jgi:hypothetical protein